MLDQLDLVHMNGRIYDPLMARFLSADPMIQDPAHSQSYNRYTYVWNNPTNLTDPTGFVAADERDLLSDTLAFIKSGLGFTESKSEPADEKTKTTGSADNSGGQGKSSQTVTVTGSLAQARFEQWLLAKTIEAAYGARDTVVKYKRPIVAMSGRVAVRAGGQMAVGAISGPAAPVVEGLIVVGTVYQLGKGIYDIVKMSGEGDTSAEDALNAGANSTGGDPNDGGNNNDDEPKRNKKASSSKVGDKVRTPDSHPEDFNKFEGTKFRNTKTGEIFERSNTNHTDKAGEWKVGSKPGQSPRPTDKITVGSDGKVLKF